MPNLPDRLALLSQLSLSYMPIECDDKLVSKGEVIRLHHLADGMFRATVTIQKVINRSGDDREIKALLTSYIDTVERLTDLKVLEELTIKERRSEILFVPLMQCLNLLMLNLDRLIKEEEKDENET